MKKKTKTTKPAREPKPSRPADKERKKTVEFINVFNARETFSKMLDAVQITPHVVLRHGAPMAVIVGVEGRDVVDLVREVGAGARKRSTSPAGDGDGVTFVKVRHAREQLSAVLEAAQSKPHVVLNGGKPSAVILGVEGRQIGDLVAEFEGKAPAKKGK